ncbi:MAG: hypothetical protein EOM20_16120 [Spartobacteria bacterium]|nr:hypothetical protein [Spartobacteria bacterium]
MNFFKYLGVLLTVIATATMLTACESDSSSGGGDDPDSSAAEISGDAALKVINESDYDSTVYFDGVYIGMVDSDSYYQWDVPTGTHEIKIDNAELDNSDAARLSVNFQSGMISPVTINWEEDDNNSFNFF